MKRRIEGGEEQGGIDEILIMCARLLSDGEPQMHGRKEFSLAFVLRSNVADNDSLGRALQNCCREEWKERW